MNPYYEDEWVTLYHGDALEMLPSLPTEYYSFVALDPPYAMAPVAVAGKDDGAAGASSSPIRLLSETAREARRCGHDQPALPPRPLVLGRREGAGMNRRDLGAWIAWALMALTVVVVVGLLAFEAVAR